MIKKHLIIYSVLATVALYSYPQSFAMENESQEDNISQTSQQKTIENKIYIGGGIVGSLIGFGIGHHIQGRFLEGGWIFTVLDIGLIIGGGALGNWIGNPLTNVDARNFLYILLTLGIGLRVWQAIDAWWLPDHYKVVRNIEFSPDLYTTNNGDLALGLSLKYRF